ncbi:hypothetical protein FQR65_LT19133 [Abscondita terminalis]|nr:hypothetical protein FQR65_LT19133 [Abscondita terminalis]
MNIISNFKSVVENKKTDTVTWTDKEIAWSSITKQFNAISPGNTFRSKEPLKKLYENKKKEARRSAANEKREVLKTGGGPATQVIKDPAMDILLDITNSKTIVGLDNPVDGDALLWGTEPEVETAIIENSCANHTEDVITNETETDWGNHTPIDLRAPINKKLKTTVSNPEEATMTVKVVHCFLAITMMYGFPFFVDN